MKPFNALKYSDDNQAFLLGCIIISLFYFWNCMVKCAISFSKKKKKRRGGLKIVKLVVIIIIFLVCQSSLSEITVMIIKNRKLFIQEFISCIQWNPPRKHHGLQTWLPWTICSIYLCWCFLILYCLLDYSTCAFCLIHVVCWPLPVFWHWFLPQVLDLTACVLINLLTALATVYFWVSYRKRDA